MGNKQNDQTRQRKYDPGDDDILEIGVDEEIEGFQDSTKDGDEEETKDSSNFPLREKPQPRTDSKRTENAVNESRKLFLEGNRLFREGRFDSAKSYYEHALLVLRDQLTDHPASAALAMSNIGILEFSAGRYNQAKQLLKDALELRQRVGIVLIVILIINLTLLPSLSPGGSSVNILLHVVRGCGWPRRTRH